MVPAEGQESVWDYPRPPALDVVERHVVVASGDVVLADARRAIRVLETSHPPTFYVHRDDLRLEHFAAGAGSSFCEWKGMAAYLDLIDPRPVPSVAWWYPEPSVPFAALRDHVAFYPQLVDCTVDGEPVQPQPGRFYGGWVTSDVVGPFKGEPGSNGW